MIGLCLLFIVAAMAATPCGRYLCVNELYPPEPEVCMFRINESLAYVKYKCGKAGLKGC